MHHVYIAILIFLQVFSKHWCKQEISEYNE